MSDDAAVSVAMQSIPPRATRAIVDLDAIAGNVRALRASLPASTRLLAVVKADGYGHGSTWVARTALEAGAAALGVATISEGQALRSAGIDAPILLLGSIEPSEAAAACKAGLEITIADERLLAAVQAAARDAAGAPVPIHLKLDTGLRRYGALPGQAVALARRVSDDPHLVFAGISTHFASADEPGEPFTHEQLARFDRTVADIAAAGIAVPARHVSNSAAVLTGVGVDFELVRPGIALYGVPPSDHVDVFPGMRPAMSLESRIARIIPLSPGDTVGYNRTYRADKPARGALLPIGYGDGYRRSLAGRSWVDIQGTRARLIGRVSMDQIVVEVPPGVDAREGDRVHLLGGGDSVAPTAADMAELMGTNTYEVLVGFRQRIPRVYVRDGEVVGILAPGA